MGLRMHIRKILFKEILNLRILWLTMILFVCEVAAYLKIKF